MTKYTLSGMDDIIRQRVTAAFLRTTRLTIIVIATIGEYLVSDGGQLPAHWSLVKNTVRCKLTIFSLTIGRVNVESCHMH
jgi:hypothetical protein